MARPGHVIAQHRRRPRTEENRARRQDAFGYLPRIARHHLAVLRREPVRQRHAVIQRLHLNQPAVGVERAFNEVTARELGHLLRDFLFDGLQNLVRGRRQPDTFVAGAVFRLCQQVGGDEFRVRRLISKHEQLARAGQQINGDVADEQPLGGDDVGVAGAENLLHAPNRLGAVSQRGNRLRAADAVNLRCPRHARREKQRGIDGAVPAAWRADNNFPAAGNFGERHGHQSG